MKILIIAPQYKPRGQSYELPLGLAYISSSLTSHGWDVQFVNLNETDWDTARVRWADTVMTGGLSVHYHKVREILVRAKRENPGIRTVVGGGLFSSMPEMMFDMLSPHIDIGVVGEGEELQWSMNMGKITTTNPIQDLDSIPFPDYEGLCVRSYLDRQSCGDEYNLYPVDKPRCMPIISSRSCPHNCSFCFHPTGRTYRQRSLDNFFEEVDMLVNMYSVNMLSIMDELISASPERLMRMCEGLGRYNLKWSAQIRVDSVDEDTIRMMKDAGCFSVSVGIEHINQCVLDGYRKRTTRKMIEDTLALLYKHGIGIQGNILLGGPDETPVTQAEATQWRDAHARYMVNLTAVIPYPGTELFNQGVKSGKINPRMFVAQECPYINFTGNSLEIPFNFVWGKVISFKDGTLTAECPHCGFVSRYPDIYWGATGIAFTQGQSYRIGCRACNQRMDLRW